MAELDISRRAVLQSLTTIGKLTLGMQKTLPYGPRNEVLTPTERRLNIQDMDIGLKLQEMKSMGPEAWDAYMKELYNG
jgi:hypothetical protein